MLDLGKTGRTIQDAYEKGSVDRALTSGASFVTVGFGVDDCLRVDLSEFTGLLHRLLDEAEATPTAPLLLTGVWLPYPAHLTIDHWDEVLAPFNDAIRNAADDRSVRLVDVAARVEKQVARGRSEQVRDGEADERHIVIGSRLIGHMVLQALRASGAGSGPMTNGRRSLNPLRRVSA